MASPITTLDAEVRLFVYRHFVEAGRAPSKAEVAGRLGIDAGEVAAAFKRLGEGKALVLQPKSGEILMAEPFSAVPTAFTIEVEGRSWWGNCIWDALGIPAMLGRDATVHTSCGDCGEAMTLDVRGGALVPAAGVVHYAVPAHRWWQDVVYA